MGKIADIAAYRASVVVCKSTGFARLTGAGISAVVASLFVTFDLYMLSVRDKEVQHLIPCSCIKAWPIKADHFTRPGELHLFVFKEYTHSLRNINQIEMSSDDIALPIIDLSGYLNPKSPEGKRRVIEEVRDAAQHFGFFQVKGHGVPLQLQKDLIRCMGNIFDLPREEKLKMSFLENPCRRGYEAAGMSHREGDALPDAKEVNSHL